MHNFFVVNIPQIVKKSDFIDLFSDFTGPFRLKILIKLNV